MIDLTFCLRSHCLQRARCIHLNKHGDRRKGRGSKAAKEMTAETRSPQIEELSVERCPNMGPFGDVQETPFQTTVLLLSNGCKLLFISSHACHLAGAKQWCAE